MVRGKAAEETTPPKQTEMAGIERTQASREAERYAEIADDIANKKHDLQKQGETVVKAMRAINQKVLSYTDDYGYKHVFTVVDGVTRLRHSKREEA